MYGRYRYQVRPDYVIYPNEFERWGSPPWSTDEVVDEATRRETELNQVVSEFAKTGWVVEATVSSRGEKPGPGRPGGLLPEAPTKTRRNSVSVHIFR